MSVVRAGLFLIGSTLMGSGAQAALFCVDTSAELQQALTTAGSNAEADTIRIDSGQYEVSSGAVAFEYITNQSFALTVAGGYLTCIVQSIGPNATVLSGSNARQVMTLFASGNTLGGMTISDLTLRSGASAQPGAGLGIVTGTGFDGNISLTRLTISDNVSTSTTGGVNVWTEGVVRVSNNLFLRNRCANGTGSCAMRITADAVDPSVRRVYVGGNTFVENACSAGAPVACTVGGVRIDGSARAAIYNNAFAFNGGVDLNLVSTATEYFHNNVASRIGAQPAMSGGNLELADPLFVNRFDDNYRLTFASPLRNAGTSAYSIGTFDLDGNARVNEFVVDIGAFENHELVFADGFDFVQ